METMACGTPNMRAVGSVLIEAYKELYGDNRKKGCSNDVHMLRHAKHTLEVKL